MKMIPFGYIGEICTRVGCPGDVGEETGYTDHLPVGRHAGRYKVVAGELVERPGWKQEEAGRDAGVAVAQQEREIRARYAAMLVAIAAPYGAAERETWKTQEEEARLWTADPDAPCSMIRAMATTRGITMELMVAKILNSADKFRAASGKILGMQQAELDLLYPERKEEV